MDTFFENMQKLSVGRLLALVGVIGGTAAFLFWAVSKVMTPPLELLYADLTPSDSGQIISKLEGMSIPHEVRGDGTQIYVPADNVGRLRLAMAEAGLPGGANMGYEIFDKSDVLGTNSFVQNINHLRALEGELARTIVSLGSVQSARVHLVLPRKELFSKATQKPTASVVVKMRGNLSLSQTQIESIQHLVAAAVPALSPDNVALIDGAGNLLARGQGDVDAKASHKMDEARLAYEEKLSKSIESLLEKSVGLGKVRAEVSVTIDPEHFKENSEQFNPEGQVARSTKTSTEENSKNSGSAQAVSAQNEVPGQNKDAEGSQGGGEAKKKNDIVTNYEISRTVKQLFHEPGGVKRLSVAVLVDGTYKSDDKGKKTYAPRENTQMDLLKKLVKSAVGFNEERGDAVEVVNMQFADLGEDVVTPPEATIMGLKRYELMRLIEIGSIFILGILFLFLVVRPIFNRLTTPAESAASPAALEGQTVGALPAPANSQAANSDDPIRLPTSELDRMIDIHKVEGQVRASSVKKIGEIIDNHPDEAVAILRTWLMKS